MYVAVKGGEAAIANAHKLLGERRRGDKSLPSLTLAQIVEQLGLAVDRVMAEGSLYDRELAALSIKQGRGDLIEAIFLLRAYRTTLPRFFAAYLAIYFAVFGFLPSILSNRLGVGQEIGGLLTAVAVAAGAAGCLVCGQILARGVRPWRILLASFGALALTGFGIFSDGVPAPAAYALSIVFSFIGGFIPVVLIDAAPRHAPRPELVGARPWAS